MRRVPSLHQHDPLLQATKEGVLVILRHRKALLQKLAAPYAPTVNVELNMKDFVAAVGGPLLDTIVEQLFLDDRGMADALDVLCGRAGPPSAHNRVELCFSCVSVCIRCPPRAAYVLLCHV